MSCYHEKIMVKDKPRIFRSALEEALRARPFDGCQADVFDVKFYEEIISTGGHLYLANNRSCGYYVTSAGEIGAIFKHPTCNYPAKLLLKTAVRNGGCYMNAYATQRLEKIYVLSHFKPVARMKFCEELAPVGWQETILQSKPDVVFLVYSPNEVYKAGDGIYFEDYDAANYFAFSSSRRTQFKSISKI